MHRTGWIAFGRVLVVGSVCLAATAARAQKSSNAPGTVADAEAVELHFVGQTPGLRYDIYPARADQDEPEPIATCAGSCWISLRRGEYRLRVRAADGGGQAIFEIEERSQVQVSSRSSGDAYFGLGTGIVGSVAVFVGFVLITPALLAANCHNGDRCESHDTETAVGLSLLCAGAIATPLGWSTFARYRRPQVEVVPVRAREAARRDQRAPFSVRPSFGSHGAALSAAIRF